MVIGGLLVMLIENTIYSGTGKPVYDHFDPTTNIQLVDWKGANIIPRDEYYTFGEAGEILVNFDEVELYLFGEYGMFDKLQHLIDYVESKYGILPEIIIK